MKEKDDGVFPNVQATTPDETRRALMEFSRRFDTAHTTWLDGTRNELERMKAQVNTSPRTAEDLEVLRKLEDCLVNFETTTHREHQAFVIGQLLREAQIRFVSSDIQRARRSRGGGKRGSKKAATTRMQDAEQDAEKIRGIYNNLRKTHTVWKDDQVYDYIVEKHGDRFERGLSKSKIRRAIKGK